MRTTPIRVAVCLKRVPIPGARIAVTEDAQHVQTAHLGFTMSPHEECAVEESVRLLEAVGGAAVAFTLGPADAEEQLRYAISLGMSSGVLVETDGSDADPQATSAALAAAITAVEERDGAFDLILFGNESADSGGYQVGIRAAHVLGRPMVNGIKHIDVDDDEVQLSRPTGAATEQYRLPLPACAGVREGLNLPRYPTFRGRLASKKATVERRGDPIVAGGQRLVELVPTNEQVSETVVLGTGPDAASAIVDLLDELGVLA